LAMSFLPLVDSALISGTHRGMPSLYLKADYGVVVLHERISKIVIRTISSAATNTSLKE
jgi:hypothetical protein